MDGGAETTTTGMCSHCAARSWTSSAEGAHHMARIDVQAGSRWPKVAAGEDPAGGEARIAARASAARASAARSVSNARTCGREGAPPPPPCAGRTQTESTPTTRRESVPAPSTSADPEISTTTHTGPPPSSRASGSRAATVRTATRATASDEKARSASRRPDEATVFKQRRGVRRRTGTFGKERTMDPSETAMTTNAQVEGDGTPLLSTQETPSAPVLETAAVSTFDHFVDGGGLTRATWAAIDAKLAPGCGARTTGSFAWGGGLPHESQLDAEKTLALASMGMMARDADGATPPIDVVRPSDATSFARSRIAWMEGVTRDGDAAIDAAIAAAVVQARAPRPDEATRAMASEARRAALVARLEIAGASEGRVVRRAMFSDGAALVSRAGGGWLGAEDALELAMLAAESAPTEGERESALLGLAETFESRPEGGFLPTLVEMPTHASFVDADTPSMLDMWLAGEQPAASGTPAPDGFMGFFAGGDNKNAGEEPETGSA